MLKPPRPWATLAASREWMERVARKQIMIVDDDDLVRVGLRALLADDKQFEIVAEARNGREAVRLARRCSPDVVVMDVSMPDMNGIDATARIRQAVDGVRVLALSTHRDGRYVRRMLDAGAAGYLPKMNALDEMLAALRAVAAGQTYLSPAVTSELLTAMSGEATEGGGALEDLTLREREVLQLVAEGRSASEVAGQLSLSVKTVETHRRRVMHKLGIDSVAGLTRFALRHGIIELD